MICLSRNEIRAECEKALRGAGLPWGLARDGGMMAAWLGGMGLPFLGALNRVAETGIRLRQGADDINSISLAAAPVPAPAYGLVLAEQVAATGISWTGGVIAPRYLLAGIAILAKEQGIGFEISSRGRLMARAAAGQFHARAEGWEDGEYTLARINAAASPHKNSHSDMARLGPNPDMTATVPKACWRQLGLYAKETYVPETDEKRARGAGAGNIDNS